MDSKAGLAACLFLAVATNGCMKASAASARAPLSQSPSVLAPGRYEETLKSGEFDRQFVVHVPKGYDGTHPIPVVVVLHGFGSNAEQAEAYFGFVQKGDTDRFATIFPQGLGNRNLKGWNAGFLNLSGKPGVDDVKFVSDLLDWSEKHLKIDSDREYVAGHSNGAMLSNLVAAKLSKRLAAAGSVSGTIGLGTPSIPTPDSPISVILIHGKADHTVAYANGGQALMSKVVGAEDAASWWAGRDACNPEPTTTKPAPGVLVEDFGGGRGDTAVELVSVEDGSHIGPMGKSGLQPVDLIWSFFKAHPKRPG